MGISRYVKSEPNPPAKNLKKFPVIHLTLILLYAIINFHVKHIKASKTNRLQLSDIT